MLNKSKKIDNNLSIKHERDILELISQDRILSKEFVKLPESSQNNFIRLLIKYGHRYYK